MRKRTLFFLSIVLVFFWGTLEYVAAAPPLQIAVYVDQDLLKSFSGTLSMKIELAEIFLLASKHFEEEIGRPLAFSVLGVVEVPHEFMKSGKLNGEFGLRWLYRRRLEMKEDRLFLIVSMPIFYNEEKNSGLVGPPEQVAIVHYSGSRFETQITLLHELGHLCGIPEAHAADSDRDSIMHNSSSLGKTYGKFIPVIKEWCGERISH